MIRNPFSPSGLDDESDGTSDPEATFRRNGLGLGSASAVVASSMIGAGVYTTSGFSLADLGRPSEVMVVWVVGGLIAICGALCYGALAQRFTESGGEYLFLARAVHPAAGMMAGWVSLLAGFTGAMAFAAATFEVIARGTGLSWIVGLPQHSIAIALIAIAACIHAAGVGVGARIQNVVVVVKLVLIGAFLLVAYGLMNSWQGGDVLPAGATSAEELLARGSSVRGKGMAIWLSVLAFANALTWVSLSYSGFNAAVYLTDEIKHPRKNVPLAMVLGTCLVTVLYLLLNVVFVYAPASTEVAGRPDVAIGAAEALDRQLAGGSIFPVGYLVALVRVAILAGLGTSVLALMQTGPRVYRKMAADGFLPQWLDEAGPNEAELKAPRHGILLQAVLGIMVVCVASVRDQLDYLGLTLSVSAAICGALVFFLRNHPVHPVRVPGYPWVPLIYVGGTLLIAGLTAYRVPVQGAVALGTLGTGLVAYLLSGVLWGSRPSGDRRN